MTIIHGEPADRYHASGAFGIHSLMDFEDRGPRFFQLRHVTKQWRRDDASKAMDIGSAAHLLTLEGIDAYNARVAVRPSTYPNADGEPKSWTMAANYCKAWVAERAGKLILSEEENALVYGMQASVAEHPAARELLCDGKAEVSLRRDYDGVPLQCRFDYLHSQHMVDIKTCDTINGFERDIFKYNYHRQAAHYEFLHEEETGLVAPMFFIAVEKAAPHRVGVFRLSEAAFSLAYDKNAELRSRVKRCMEKNEWPIGHLADVQEVKLPRWAQSGEYMEV